MGPEKAWRGQRRPRIAVAHRIVGETRDNGQGMDCAFPTVPVPVLASASQALLQIASTALSASRPAGPQALALDTLAGDAPAMEGCTSTRRVAVAGLGQFQVVPVLWLAARTSMRYWCRASVDLRQLAATRAGSSTRGAEDIDCSVAAPSVLYLEPTLKF